MFEPFLIVVFESLNCPQCEKMDLKIIQSLLVILLKLFTFSQILQGVPKLSHATVYMQSGIYAITCQLFFKEKVSLNLGGVQTKMFYAFCPFIYTTAAF